MKTLINRVLFLSSTKILARYKKMNTKLKNSLLFGLGMSSASALAADENPYADLHSVPGEYEIVMVPKGTPLYQVASEYTRGDKNLENGILRTSMCDSVETRLLVSRENNAIAKLTAKVAEKYGLDGLRTAMLLDDQKIVIKNDQCADVALVYESDGLLGDGFAALEGYHGFVPAAIPNSSYQNPVVEAYNPTVTISETTPSVTITPAVPSPVENGSEDMPECTWNSFDEECREIPSVPDVTLMGPHTNAGVPDEAPLAIPYVAEGVQGSAVWTERQKPNFLAGGYQYISEAGKAPLSGHGLWFSGRGYLPLDDNGVALNVHHIWLDFLQYASSRKDHAVVSDVDASAVYLFPLNGTAHLDLGINFDGRTASVDYAGVHARTGQFAISPEVAFHLEKEKFLMQGRVSAGLGNVSTHVAVPGFQDTEDSLLKFKLEADAAYRLGPVRVGPSLEIENDQSLGTTQDGGQTNQTDLRFTLGGQGSVTLADGLEGVLDLGWVHYIAPISNTDSFRGALGLKYSFGNAGTEE
ncbi:hypothetical protein HZA98_01240 [Candidatus Woesearchaeota archaeon]|nr:hypothetical protein [Candidatus Woesearchaeota archaeon]